MATLSAYKPVIPGEMIATLKSFIAQSSG